ncbi:hypothetical protein PDJAM_G00135220 [Pangasius djambal]|uniref:Uncharacterized protein n=1 Tax=Pangasius djambal TaxID=1691987 RepID=A0ACC5ZE35_9TELE|nr:hypothetical protein [Pangasius djambal]
MEKVKQSQCVSLIQDSGCSTFTCRVMSTSKSSPLSSRLRQDESRWFGQLWNGQQGYFPASCVIELSHNTDHRDGAAKNGEGLRRRCSVQVESVVILRERAGGGRQQAPRGGEREEGPFLTLKQDAQAPSSAHSSPSLLHRILSKHLRKSQCQGASNRATEHD